MAAFQEPERRLLAQMLDRGDQLACHDERGTIVRRRRLAVRCAVSRSASKDRPRWSWSSLSTSEPTGRIRSRSWTGGRSAKLRRRVPAAGAGLATGSRVDARRYPARRPDRLDRPQVPQRAGRGHRRGSQAGWPARALSSPAAVFRTAFSWSTRSGASTRRDFVRTGTSACRPTTAASRSARPWRRSGWRRARHTSTERRAIPCASRSPAKS